jgi:hypothetical protein
MRKLYILATAAALLVSASAPSLAASRAHRGTDAYASGAVSTDRSGPYYYGPQGARNTNAQDRAPFAQAPFVDAPSYNRGQNLPYPDRPYGAPDSW